MGNIPILSIYSSRKFGRRHALFARSGKLVDTPVINFTVTGTAITMINQKPLFHSTSPMSLAKILPYKVAWREILLIFRTLKWHDNSTCRVQVLHYSGKGHCHLTGFGHFYILSLPPPPNPKSDWSHDFCFYSTFPPQKADMRRMDGKHYA